MLLFYVCKSIVLKNQSHSKGKLVNCEHCFEKGSCPKENFQHKEGFFCIKGLPNVTLLCVQEVIQLVGTNISCERRTSQLWTLSCKRVHAQRNFLYKGGCPLLLFHVCTCLFSLFMWGYFIVHSKKHLQLQLQCPFSLQE